MSNISESGLICFITRHIIFHSSLERYCDCEGINRSLIFMFRLILDNHLHIFACHASHFIHFIDGYYRLTYFNLIMLKVALYWFVFHRPFTKWTLNAYVCAVLHVYGY